MEHTEPKLIVAHYDTQCHGCGVEIFEGDEVYWMPTNRKLYCLDCGEEGIE